MSRFLTFPSFPSVVLLSALALAACSPTFNWREVRPEGTRLNLLLLHDSDQSVARQYDLEDLPMTVLLDPHGKVRYVHRKYRGSDAALYAEELGALLQE